MPRSGNDPQRFGFGSPRKELAGLRNGRSVIARAGDDEHGSGNLVDVIDGPQLILVHACDMREGLKQWHKQRRRNRARDFAEGSAQAICQGGLNIRVHRLENEGINRQRTWPKHCGRAAKRCTNRPYPLFGQSPTDELERGASVQRLERAERDALSGAFAMGLKIEQENGKPLLVQQSRAPDHAQSI